MTKLEGKILLLHIIEDRNVRQVNWSGSELIDAAKIFVQDPHLIQGAFCFTITG